MSTFDIGVPVPRRTGTQLPLARQQLVRNRDRQIQRVHDRTCATSRLPPLKRYPSRDHVALPATMLMPVAKGEVSSFFK